MISTLTTIITLTGTTLTTSIVARPAAAAAKPGVVSGNTIRNIAAMHLMGIAEQPASSVDVARVGPVVRAVLVVLEDRAVQVVLAVPAVSGDPAAQAALGSLAAQAALENRAD